MMKKHVKQQRRRASTKQIHNLLENSLARIFTMPPVMPDRLRVRLPYSSFKSYTTTTTCSNQIVSINSAFDPDTTGVGHQPRGFDQWAPGFYNRYTVVGASLEVRVVNSGASAGIVCVYPTLGGAPGTLATVIHDAMELPNARWQLTSDVPRATDVLRDFRTAAQCFGVPFESMLVDDFYQSAYNNSPGNEARWVIAVQGADEVTSSTNLIEYRVIYDIVFFGRVTLQES